ncbi:MAG: hypothetical protein JWN76_1214 [Chitinophagaceae bacterium]|nr:hypothetical protein [Chitinophagaceae bacterium]
MAALLKRIVNTISFTVLWMISNSTIGLMYDLAFIHDKLTIGNVLFYLWLVTSTFFYLRWLIKTWSKPLA